MKVLGINGSPRREGNTCKLIGEIHRGAEQNGHSCELVHLVDLHLDYCSWCLRCKDTGICVIKDGFQEHLQSLFAADVLIVASPSSTMTVTGYMKNWLDRFCNSQIIYEVDPKTGVSMHSRVPAGKMAVIVAHGCTGQLDATVLPMKAGIGALQFAICDTLVIPSVGRTDDDSMDKHPDMMARAFEIGRGL